MNKQGRHGHFKLNRPLHHLIEIPHHVRRIGLDNVRGSCIESSIAMSIHIGLVCYDKFADL